MVLDNEIGASGTFSSDFNVTGSRTSISYKIIICPFNQYELKIKLTPDNKFVEVVEIKINKDFLSHQQKMATLNSLDIESFL